MKQQDVFKKIGIIIKELNEQYDYLVKTENELNDLELELFVANAHFLAEHSEVLRKLNLQNASSPIITPVHTEKYFEPVVQQLPPPVETQPANDEITTSLPPDTPAKPIGTTFTNSDADENPVPHIDLRGDDTGSDYSYIRHELTLDDIPHREEEDDEVAGQEASRPEEEIIEKPPVEVPKNEPVTPIKETPRVEAKVEDVPEELLTINQKISAQLKNTGNRASEHLNAQPVADLKQAITLNDKLLYIKDLFNGYNLAYSEAIDILNRFATFDEADKFLKSSYVIKNSWESKQATADKFYALLKRRYS
ncbi:MAG: hypothetical protein JWR54_2735 [Mucilaginibacter sp.]|jgi:hypothetical protein|nr:hypothetical protein [Mucilaginibacter sp.]